MVEEIDLIKKNGYIACAFGTGFVGCGTGFDLLKKLDIPILFYCDNDSNKWGEIVIEDILCYPPEHILTHKKVVVFVLIARDGAAEEVREQIMSMGVDHVITYGDLMYCDEYIDSVFGFNNKHYRPIKEKKSPRYLAPPIENYSSKRIAIYTCITGNYDCLERPETIEADQADYYVISDDPSMQNSIYKNISIDSIVPDSVDDNIRKNRFCKILGCDIFANYHYSIYLDGKLRIMAGLCDYIDEMNEGGIIIRREEPPFDCLYMEGLWALNTFGYSDIITTQMNKYYNEGMPRHWGAFECSCIIRDNWNRKVRKSMRDWWHEVYNYSFRDQNSFTYALWKNNYRSADIQCMEGTLNRDDRLKMINSHR